jgi:hypothetical protein
LHPLILSVGLLFANDVEVKLVTNRILVAWSIE